LALVFAVWAGSAQTASPPTIPLQAGLVISATVNQGGTDYERATTLARVDDEGALFVTERALKEQNLVDRRFVRKEDLVSAAKLYNCMFSGDPDLFPGTTFAQLASEPFAALSAGGEFRFVLGDCVGPPGVTTIRKYFRGTLRMLGRGSVPVLVDGARTELPAIHVAGALAVGSDGGNADFWFLDQADNALLLRETFRDNILQTVRIDRTPAAAAPVEAVAPGLASPACRAELHGIYFDTGSASLLPASDATLAAVAALLKVEKDWTVAVEGHTDNLGGTAYNLALSQKRAEAVRAALVERYDIDPARLRATGLGETRPVETNDTIEGRAHNRRVELSRHCP
jgi:outer membrane protein OmpA-like peptidoglycan-associated protein